MVSEVSVSTYAPRLTLRNPTTPAKGARTVRFAGRLRRFQSGLGHAELGAQIVQIGRRHQPLGAQRAGALHLQTPVRQFALGFAHRRSLAVAIQFDQRRAGLDPLSCLEGDMGDPTRRAGHDFDGTGGAGGADRRDGFGDRTQTRGDGFDHRRLGLARAWSLIATFAPDRPVPATAGRQRDQRHHDTELRK